MKIFSNWLEEFRQEISPVTYNIIFGFLLLSGLNVLDLRIVSIFNFISPMRVMWVGLLLYLLIGLDPKKIKLSLPIYLIIAWVLWNNLIFFYVGGSTAELVTRWFQSAFIMVLYLSIQQDKFNVANFCASIHFIWPFLLMCAFFIFHVILLLKPEIIHVFWSSVFGMKTNFSIFCAQFIALFLLRNLFFCEHKKSKAASEVLSIIYWTLPFLVWQVACSGRSGVLITLIIIPCFFLLRFNWLSAFISAVATLGTVAFINNGITIFYRILKQRGSPRVHNGIFYAKTSILNSFFESGEQLSLAVKFLDNFMSGRISVLIEALSLLNSNTLIFGAGLNIKRITFGEQLLQPHVELLRHLLDIGLVGALIALAIYALPFFLKRSCNTNRFLMFYVIAVLVITFLQPSGPLSHLSNAIVFWMAYSFMNKCSKTSTVHHSS